MPPGLDRALAGADPLRLARIADREQLHPGGRSCQPFIRNIRRPGGVLHAHPPKGPHHLPKLRRLGSSACGDLHRPPRVSSTRPLPGIDAARGWRAVSRDDYSGPGQNRPRTKHRLRSRAPRAQAYRALSLYPPPDVRGVPSHPIGFPGGKRKPVECGNLCRGIRFTALSPGGGRTPSEPGPVVRRLPAKSALPIGPGLF